MSERERRRSRSRSRSRGGGRSKEEETRRGEVRRREDDNSRNKDNLGRRRGEEEQRREKSTRKVDGKRREEKDRSFERRGTGGGHRRDGGDRKNRNDDRCQDTEVRRSPNRNSEKGDSSESKQRMGSSSSRRRTRSRDENGGRRKRGGDENITGSGRDKEKMTKEGEKAAGRDREKRGREEGQQSDSGSRQRRDGEKKERRESDRARADKEGNLDKEERERERTGRVERSREKGRGDRDRQRLNRDDKGRDGEGMKGSTDGGRDRFERDNDGRREKRRMSRERERRGKGERSRSGSRKRRKVEARRSKSRSLSDESNAREKEKRERGLIMKEETKKLKEILDLKTKMAEQQREAREAEKRGEEEEKKLKMEADAVVTHKKRTSTESLRHNPNHVSQYQSSMSGRGGGEDSDESDDDIEILRRGGSARVLAPSIGVKAMPPSMLVQPEPVPTPKPNYAIEPEPLYARDVEPEPSTSTTTQVPKLRPKSTASKTCVAESAPPAPSDPKATILTCGVCQTDSLNIYVDDQHFTEPGHQRAMLTMGEMISDFVNEHKKVKRMIDKTLLKEEERKRRVLEAEKKRAEEAKRKELYELMKESEPEIEVIKEEEPEIKVIDPKKSPFLSPTPYLVVTFDVKLTDSCWASEIYQLGARSVSSQYSTYILPHGRLNWDVSDKVGLKIREANNGVGGKRLVTFDIENPTALEKERPVQSQLPWYGYSSFLDWIEMQKEKGKYKKVMLLGCSNMAMPALLNKLATENLVQEASRIIDCFATITPYLRKYHPELGDNLKIDDLSGKLLPEAAIKQHDPLDTARRSFLILQNFSESNIVERLLEKNTPMEKALEVSKGVIAKAVEKRKREVERSKGKNRSMAMIVPSILAL